jgi:hypothetical protein
MFRTSHQATCPTEVRKSNTDTPTASTLVVVVLAVSVGRLAGSIGAAVAVSSFPPRLRHRLTEVFECFDISPCGECEVYRLRHEIQNACYQK